MSYHIEHKVRDIIQAQAENGCDKFAKHGWVVDHVEGMMICFINTDINQQTMRHVLEVLLDTDGLRAVFGEGFFVASINILKAWNHGNAVRKAVVQAHIQMKDRQSLIDFSNKMK